MEETQVEAMQVEAMQVEAMQVEAMRVELAMSAGAGTSAEAPWVAVITWDPVAGCTTTVEALTIMVATEATAVLESMDSAATDWAAMDSAAMDWVATDWVTAGSAITAAHTVTDMALVMVLASGIRMTILLGHPLTMHLVIRLTTSCLSTP